MMAGPTLARERQIDREKENERESEIETDRGSHGKTDRQSEYVCALYFAPEGRKYISVWLRIPDLV